MREPTANSINLHIAQDRNRTRATLIGGERPRYCTVLSPKKERRDEVGWKRGGGGRTEGTTRYSIPGFEFTTNVRHFPGRNCIVLEHIHKIKKKKNDTHV